MGSCAEITEEFSAQDTPRDWRLFAYAIFTADLIDRRIIQRYDRQHILGKQIGLQRRNAFSGDLKLRQKLEGYS